MSVNKNEITDAIKTQIKNNIKKNLFFCIISLISLIQNVLQDNPKKWQFAWFLFKNIITIFSLTNKKMLVLLILFSNFHNEKTATEN